MYLHVLLEVEIGELVGVIHLQELEKGFIRKDLPIITRILKFILLEVVVDPSGDVRPGDELILRETQECRQLG